MLLGISKSSRVRPTENEHDDVPLLRDRHRRSGRSLPMVLNDDRSHGTAQASERYPMYLKRITLKNFRCFESIDIDLHPQLTVLVGVNGAGKTAILDGIAAGLSPVLRYLSSANQRLSAAGAGIRDTDFRLVPSGKKSGRERWGGERLRANRHRDHRWPVLGRMACFRKEARRHAARESWPQIAGVATLRNSRKLQIRGA